jgi:hypothetical protein
VSPLPLLIVEFAAEKVHMIQASEHVVSAINASGISANIAAAQIQHMPPLEKTMQIGNRVAKLPLLRERWRIPMLAKASDEAVALLKARLAEEEVHDIRVEDP